MKEVTKMGVRTLFFEDEGPWTPTRAFADGWSQTRQAWWRLFLDAYRIRVNDSYRLLYEPRPACFPLVGPTEVVAVASLAREWAFARGASADTVRVIERWEDPILAQSDVWDRPDHEDLARAELGLGDEYILIYSYPFRDSAYTDSAPVVDGRATIAGREQADSDAHDAYAAPELERLVGELSGRPLPEESVLADLREMYSRIEHLAPRKRGLEFDMLVKGALEAYGFTVERGHTNKNEQVDLFVSKPVHAIIECRWSARPLNARGLRDLTSKLRRRPAIVAGIYISVSGFAATARKEASDEPADRTILLWDSRELDALLSGSVHAKDLFDDSVAEVVRRYRRS
jgi:hypothetical protein